ncbi:hypothetical protein PL8927_270018 [Planktothrix serta PCC 8927]|uniref:Uncharacterized protein n=1 Tax=Planktothrix serta PCC 8927 TaxID=671068 RepID=A0A7Z9BNP8_9CYAN|nr:hypothetical protein [Planktothrix serta]VXD13529.1 hypothetical protein PL8927_270018 [Planktothrix serta PCC 8927]
MLNEQFEKLKKLMGRYCTSTTSNFKVKDDRIIKKIYYKKQSNQDCNVVIEDYHEFFIEKDKIFEKIVLRESDLAIFSGKSFVLAEGCDFGEPIKDEIEEHSSIIQLAFHLGGEVQQKQNSLNRYEWISLPKIIKELNFILVKGEGYARPADRADQAFIDFRDEEYVVTLSSQGYTVKTKGKVVGVYKTPMELVMALGIHKFQFGIFGNGGR